MRFKGYHIIVVPEDKARTKTFRVSGFSLRVLLASVIMALPLFFVSMLLTMHYQDRIVAMRRQNEDNRKLLENRRELLAKVGDLQKQLSNMDESVSHLGGIMDIDADSLRKGVGPITDMDEFDADDKEQGPIAGLHDDDEGTLFLDETDMASDLATIGSFQVKMNDLKHAANVLNKRIAEIFAQNKDKIRYASVMPNEMPVPGWITSEFGVRKHPISGTYRMHEGVDIAGPFGTQIRSPGEGIVVFAGTHGGHGQAILIEHGYGVSSLYAHLSQILVKVGDKIQRDQIIGKIGVSGSSTGPHLHYEVRIDGIPTNPMAFVTQ